MDVTHVKISKDKGGHLMAAFYAGNNEQIGRTQSYRDRHVTRLAESVHALFPLATVHVNYEYEDGTVADYELDFTASVGEQVKAHGQDD